MSSSMLRCLKRASRFPPQPKYSTVAEASPPCQARLPKFNFLGKGENEVGDLILKEYPKFKPFQVKQIFNWIYSKGVTDFQAMTNLEPALRKHLEENFCIDYGRVETEQRSLDGTIKRLIEYGIPENKAKGLVEAVLISENHRRTLCVSSQIGCSLNCTFCHTGTQKLLRNLTAGEILGQYMGYHQLLGGFPNDPQSRKISNIVFMGQGEPLLNHRNVFGAIRTLTSPQGLGFPSKRITVSTSGVVPVIPRLAELGVNLAVSLHAVSDELRNEIVPLNKQFNIQTLLDACKAFVAASPSATQRVTFEYVMLKDVNDSAKEARELVRLLHGVPAHVNLIPFNPWPGCDYECSSEEQIKEFATVVASRNVHTTIRYSKGQDIMAACGQLKSLNMSKAKRPAAKATPAPSQK